MKALNFHITAINCISLFKLKKKRPFLSNGKKNEFKKRAKIHKKHAAVAESYRNAFNLHVDVILVHGM